MRRWRRPTRLRVSGRPRATSSTAAGVHGRMFIQASEEVALPFKVSYTDFRPPAAVAAAVGEAKVQQVRV